MKQLLQIVLLFSLLLSCTKEDFKENEIPKNLIKTSASSAEIEQQPKIIITNYYSGTDSNFVFFYTNNWKKRHTVNLYGGFNSIELEFNPTLQLYTYEGEMINQIDLNYGGSYKDINFESEGNITYAPYEGERQILIKDYKNIGKERCYSVVDPTGIYGGGKNAIIQTYRSNESPNIININIMSWASKYANLDGNEHFFDPNNTSIDILFFNQDYYSNSCKDQKRMSDINFVKKKELDPYYVKSLNLGGYPVKQDKYSYYYKKKKLKRIDFNDGRSADDLNFYNSNNPGIVEYIARDANHPAPIIDSNIGFVFGTVDSDGINRGTKNAEIKAFVTGKKEISIGIYK